MTTGDSQNHQLLGVFGSSPAGFGALVFHRAAQLRTALSLFVGHRILLHGFQDAALRAARSKFSFFCQAPNSLGPQSLESRRRVDQLEIDEIWLAVFDFIDRRFLLSRALDVSEFSS